MPAMEGLCELLGISISKLSKEELIILEAELLAKVCGELKNNFRLEYQEYFHSMRLTQEMEFEMLEANFTRLVIKDILMSEEYTVEGLAQYTGIHEDVIHEVICGINTSPSATLLQRAIDLHRTVRKDLYRAIVGKVVAEYNKKDDGLCS